MSDDQAWFDAMEDLLTAVDPFLALPDHDLEDWSPFNQYTTAKDCRELNAAVRKAREFLNERKQT